VKRFGRRHALCICCVAVTRTTFSKRRSSVLPSAKVQAATSAERQHAYDLCGARGGFMLRADAEATRETEAFSRHRYEYRDLGGA